MQNKQNAGIAIEIKIPRAGYTNYLAPGGVLPVAGGYVLFRLELFSLSKSRTDLRGVYECREKGCLGCGCPSFALNEPLPAEVFSHVASHARAWHPQTKARG